jgi:uncharacterized protein YceK
MVIGRARLVPLMIVVMALLGAGLCVLSGCSSYYRVTDPGSGRTYYTKKVDHDLGSAVKFKDAKTESQVTLQSSEVKEISGSEFDAGVKGK